jgi:hypothetical protein
MKLFCLFIFIITIASCTHNSEKPIQNIDTTTKEPSQELKLEFGTSTIEYDKFCVAYLDKMFHVVGYIPDEITIFEIAEFEPSVEIVSPTVALDSGVLMYFGILNNKTKDTSRFGAFKFHKSDCFIPMECYSDAIVFKWPITTVHLPFEDNDLTCGSQNYTVEFSDSSFAGVWTQTDNPNK